MVHEGKDHEYILATALVPFGLCEVSNVNIISMPQIACARRNRREQEGSMGNIKAEWSLDRTGSERGGTQDVLGLTTMSKMGTTFLCDKLFKILISLIVVVDT